MSTWSNRNGLDDKTNDSVSLSSMLKLKLKTIILAENLFKMYFLCKFFINYKISSKQTKTC